MRRYIPALLALAVGLLPASYAFAFTGAAPAPGSGINGTVHDLSTAHNGMSYVANPADTYQVSNPPARICIFCHAPHNTIPLNAANGGDPSTGGPPAPAAFDYLPLWNHTLQTDYTYTPYYNGPGAPTTGSKASQAILLGMTVTGTSLLCLSCHDGTVAVNSYGNVSQPPHSQSGGGGFMSTSYLIGAVGTGGAKSLQNHHPIGFDYDTVQAADTEIRISTHAMGGAGTIADHLYGGTMQCGTCHSVHNTGNTGEALLWRSDGQSQLCLTCHAKGTDPLATTP